jgi:hypothetical protein
MGGHTPGPQNSTGRAERRTCAPPHQAPAVNPTLAINTPVSASSSQSIATLHRRHRTPNHPNQVPLLPGSAKANSRRPASSIAASGFGNIGRKLCRSLCAQPTYPDLGGLWQIVARRPERPRPGQPCVGCCTPPTTWSSFAQVSWPTTPSAVSPCDCWYALTACSVASPKSPSALSQGT